MRQNQGHQLIDQVVTATNLPKDAIKQELSQIIKHAGLEADTLTLDQLRIVLADYLQDILIQAKNSY